MSDECPADVGWISTGCPTNVRLSARCLPDVAGLSADAVMTVQNSPKCKNFDNINGNHYEREPKVFVDATGCLVGRFIAAIGPNKV